MAANILIGVNISPSPFGINAHLSKDAVLAKIKRAGIKWIRIDLNWSYIERKKGDFDWDEVDRVVKYAHNNGLSMLAVLSYTPSWANGNRGINYPSYSNTHWKNFVAAAVKRFKSKIKYWNIWNEPNLIEFYAYPKDNFLKKVFIPAAQQIRSSDPGAFIVGPELSHQTESGEEWFFWMKYLLTNAPNYFDVISHHMYVNEGAFYLYELLEEGEHLFPSVVEIVEETGHGGKPFWITEIGWNTTDFSENTQAEKYLEMLQKMKLKNFPQKIFFYEIMDDPLGGAYPWGILRPNLYEKPAYIVYWDFILGKYPDPVDEDGQGIEEKQCYMERMLSNSSQSIGSAGVLSHYRGVRDELKHFSDATNRVVEAYYKMGDELYQWTIQDSRLYRISNELINDFYRTDRKKEFLYNQYKLDQSFTHRIKTFFGLLKEKPISKELRDLVTWGEVQTRSLKNHTINEYLFLLSVLDQNAKKKTKTRQ